jgi:hypothetical protein
MNFHSQLAGRFRDRFPVVSLDFSVTYSFRPFHGPGVDSASSENEYQERFLGVKVPVCEADNLTTFMCRMSWKSGSLNLLEPSGPHRVCYGTALSFYESPYSMSRRWPKLSSVSRNCGYVMKNCIFILGHLCMIILTRHPDVSRCIVWSNYEVTPAAYIIQCLNDNCHQDHYSNQATLHTPLIK